MGIEHAVMDQRADGLWALVLAGGDGRRLQDLTRRIAGAPIPKQYCRIVGDRSLLEATLARIAPLVTRERTLAIVNREHLALATPQLRTVPGWNVVVQPQNRETGPGMLLSLLVLARRRPDATVAVFPSDHHIGDERKFRAHVAHMARLVDAHPDRIALLGVEPERPESGYGYIRRGAAVAPDAFDVLSFHEKPTPALATRLSRHGALWNSFVMVFRVARMLELLRDARPGICARLAALLDDPAQLASAYPTIARWNFSRDFLARIPEQLMVVRAPGIGWSDWGTPEAIERTLAATGSQPSRQLPLRATA